MQILTLPATLALVALSAAERTEPEVQALNSSAIESSSSAARLEGTGWNINAPIPEPLGVAQGATVASGDGSLIYHIGGITGAMKASNRVWVYSTADDTWFQAANIPVDPGIRTFGAAVELDGFIYVFGGFDGENILDTTWIYDETKDTWLQGASMPAPRFASAVAADGNIIWVLYGVSDVSIGGETETTWGYEPARDTWFENASGPINVGRTRAAILPNGDLHFLGGGFDGNTHCGFNFHVHYYFCRAAIPIGVTDAAVATDGARIYVLGEEGPAPRPMSPLQIFDVASGTWLFGPTLPIGLNNTSGVIAKDWLYVTGGYDGATPISANYSLALAGVRAEPAALGPELGESAVVTPFKSGDSRNGTTPWSLGWPIPESYGVAQGSTLASSDGSIVYHIGGFVGSGLYASNRLRVYSPADDARDASSLQSPWWDVASVPQSGGLRSYGSAVELNGFIYVFGGVSGVPPSEALLNTTWIYDEAKDAWSQGAQLPDYRFGSAVATDGTFIWVMGGYRGGAANTVWRYEPKTDAYSTGFQDMPIALGRIHGVYLPDETVHVLGGGPGSLTNHLIYDTAADSWSFAPPIPIGVLDPAVVTDGALIYLVGAPPDSSPPGPAHTQIFDPAAETWWEGPRLPPWPSYPDWGISNTSGAIANGIFYVMGGFTTGTVYFNYSVAISDLSVGRR